MTRSVTTVRDVATHALDVVVPFDIALSAARDSLTEHGTADINDPDEMIAATVALYIRLHGLVNALDAKDGQQ
ncbi:hypothetical protein [Streptomyces sp. NPDC047972]|uniref:hypothetical protein n=1 Tax=Streptomyces sp. NPDC047972 TaxID=3365493 RepID=UPI003711D6C2